MSTTSPEPTSVTLVHPESDQRIEVLVEHADRYTQQGWREVEAGAPPASASLKKWQEFARERGFTDAEIDGKTKDELRAALS